MAMIVKTRIFNINNNGYRNLSELARAMGISVSQIYRVREGKRPINQKFIVGAMKAFPDYTFDDLFYIVPGTLKDYKCYSNPKIENPPVQYPESSFSLTKTSG
jgi:hypothetical protein